MKNFFSAKMFMAGLGIGIGIIVYDRFIGPRVNEFLPGA